MDLKGNQDIARCMLQVNNGSACTSSPFETSNTPYPLIGHLNKFT